MGLFSWAARAAAGGAGAALGLIAFLFLTWTGFFAFIGTWLLGDLIASPGGLLNLSPLELLFAPAPLLAIPAVGLLTYRTAEDPHLVRALVATVAAMSVSGAMQAVLMTGGIPFPPLGAAMVSFYLALFSLVAAVLYLMAWGLRAVCAHVLRLAMGPGREDALLKLQLGMCGGSVAAGLGSGIAMLGGANPWLIDADWFYLMALPALIGFGLGAPPPSRPSLIFAALAALMAVSVCWAALPNRGEHHTVRCDHFAAGGRHSVFYRQAEPWTWSRAEDARGWIVTPFALAELTLWHIVDPVTDRGCPAD